MRDENVAIVVTLRYFILTLILVSGNCRRPEPVITAQNDSIAVVTDDVGKLLVSKGALLLTGFKSFAELNSVVGIKYIQAGPLFGGIFHSKPRVHLTYKIGDHEVTSILKSGTNEADFVKALNGKIWDKLRLGFKCPYAVFNKADLVCVENLGRKRPWIYGKGDVAFYDLAETMVYNISDEDITSLSSEDLSEKGYLNTFNHITAQAFMTSIFSEEIADFVADVHERHRMPELITGKFTKEQLSDLENGPVDNYIDILNNEWGQELGKLLRKKYSLSVKTKWSSQLLADYLNDIQSYHSWAFQIGFKPFRPTDEIVMRFAGKINRVISESQ